MPMLPRRGHEIGEPIEEPKRRDLDDAVGPRIRTLCDRLVCLEEPQAFWAVSLLYRDFTQAGDERVVELRRDCGQPCAARTPPHTSPDRSHESPRARARG